MPCSGEVRRWRRQQSLRRGPCAYTLYLVCTPPDLHAPLINTYLTIWSCGAFWFETIFSNSQLEGTFRTNCLVEPLITSSEEIRSTSTSAAVMLSLSFLHANLPTSEEYPTLAGYFLPFIQDAFDDSHHSRPRYRILFLSNHIGLGPSLGI